MSASATDAEVRVYWRPGCPYCARLRGDLARIGLPTREINIWDDPDAAAVVRSVANGNETVPTVVVGAGKASGATAMVNPSAGQVLQAVRTRAPDLLAGIDPRAVDRVARGRWWSGALLAVVVAAVWFGLAGPTLFGPGAVVETLVVIVIGAGLGGLLTRWRRRASASDRSGESAADLE